MRKIFTLLLGILLLSTISRAQLNATFSMPTTTGTVGTDVVVPITFDGIDTLGSLGLAITYDKAVLTYKSFTIVDSRLTGGLGNHTAGTNTFRFGWFSTDGAVFPAHSVVLNITFTYVGPGCSNLTWDKVNSFATDNALLGPFDYNVTYVDGQICKSVVPIIINANGQPQDAKTCAGSDASFTVVATGQTSYQWQVSTDGITFNNLTNDIPYSNVNTSTLNITAAPFSLNGYMYQCVLSNSDGSATTSAATLTVNDLPVVTISGGPALIVDQAGFTTYQWLLGGVVIPGETLDAYTATNTGSYSIQITDANGCQNISLPIQVNIFPPFVINGDVTATPGTICAGSSSLLEVSVSGGSGTYSYIWEPGGGTDAAQNVTPSETTQYSVTINDGYTSIVGNVTVTVNQLPNPAFDINGSTTFCAGGSVSLSGLNTEGYTYQWFVDNSPIDGATDVTYNASIAGNYTLQVTANGCSATSGGTLVTVNALPTASIDPNIPQTAYIGDSVLLTVTTAAANIQWRKDGVDINGVNTTTLWVKVDGLYSVSVDDGTCTGISNDEQVTFIVKPVFQVTVTATPSEICAGSSTSLQADAINGSGNYSYNWNNGQTEFNFSDSPAGTFEYDVTVTDNQTNEVVTGFAVVTVDNPPTAAVTPPSVNANQGEQPVLHATTGAGYGYDWYVNGVLIQGQNLDSLVITTNGDYYVIIRSGVCTTQSNTVTATFNVVYPPLQIGVTAKSSEICLGGLSTLQASVDGGSGDYSWNWSNGQTVMNFNDSPTETTLYSVTVTDNVTNLTILGEVTVTVDTPPTATLTPDGPTTFEQGGQVILNASTGAGYTYFWTKNLIVIQGENNSSLTVTESGSYEAIITSGVCSANTNSIQVDVTPLVVLNISMSAKPQELCLGASTTIQASVDGGSGDYSYNWNNDQIVLNFNDTPAATFTYMVTVTDNVNNKTITGSITVTVDTPPSVNIINETTTSFCTGGSVLLDATVDPNYTYQWFKDGVAIQDASHASYLATTSGAYSVQVIDITGVCGGVLSNNIDVTVNALPTAMINPAGPVYVLQGATTNLFATGEGYTYQWLKGGVNIDGATDNTLVAGAGSYTVEVSANGCSQLSNTVDVIETIPGVCELNVPNSVTASPVNSYNATINWNKANPGVDSAFVVRVFQTTTMNWRYRVITNNGPTTAFFGQLTPNTNYTAQVRARCTSHPDEVLHKSAYTAPIYFNTLGDVCLLATNLQANNVTDNSAFLSWNSGPSSTRYTVQYIGNNGQGTHFKSGITTNSTLLEGLKPGTTYTYSVKVFCDLLGTKRYYQLTKTFTTTGTYSPVRLADNTNVDFYVYPNPSNGVFTLSVSGVKNTINMSVMNLAGQVVYTKEYANSFTEDVDLSGLAKGVYFIKLINDNTSQVKKIVIQ